MPAGFSSGIAPNGAYGRAFNCTGRNTGVSQWNLSCNGAALMRPGNAAIVYANALAIGSPSVNITTAGPAAGGRDQAAAFPNGSQVHFYLISNGSTVRGIASLSGPLDTASPADVNDEVGLTLLGPTMPDGYLYWAYYGCVPMNGAGLYAGQFARDWFHFQSPLNLLTDGGDTGGASIAVVPSLSNCDQIICNLKGSVLTGAGGAAYSAAYLRASYNNGGSGVENRFILPVGVPVASAEIFNSAQVLIDLLNNQGATGLNYVWTDDVNPGNISARRLTVDLNAFRNRWM